MAANRQLRHIILPILLSFISCMTAAAAADAGNILFGEKKKINKDNTGHITLDIDNLNFFHNNEYWGGRTSGYTLPGFYIRPSVGYQPHKRVKIDAGVMFKHYWGANGYPSVHFGDVLGSVGDNKKYKADIKPYLRVQTRIGKYVDIVFGNIYGGMNHNLPEPLYNYERTLSTMPETGLQVLLDTKHFDLDAWVNWESFIFQNDNHQEAFTFGVSTETRTNKGKSGIQAYFPVNVLFQHRGGEIDTVPVNHRVQTWMNLSGGAGLRYDLNHRIFHSISMEANVAYYMEVEDNLMPYDNGWLFYGRLWAEIWKLRIGAAYWSAQDFISLLGNPYFGAMHVPYDGRLFKNPQVGAINLEYSQKIGKNCILGFKSDLYFTRKCKAISSKGNRYTEAPNIGFTAGAYLRFKPTFLIKDLKKKKK